MVVIRVVAIAQIFFPSDPQPWSHVSGPKDVGMDPRSGVRRGESLGDGRCAELGGMILKSRNGRGVVHGVKARADRGIFTPYPLSEIQGHLPDTYRLKETAIKQ